jgi:hypothetical protein
LCKHRALIDSGSNVCCINAAIVKHKYLPVVKQIYLSGLCGQPTLVDVERLHIKPVVEEPDCVNIAPAVHAFFAVVPGLNEDFIITPSVYQLLQDVAKNDVLAPSADNAAGTISNVLSAVYKDNDSRIMPCNSDEHVLNIDTVTCVKDDVTNSGNLACVARHVNATHDTLCDVVQSVTSRDVIQLNVTDVMHTEADARKNRDFFDPEVPHGSKAKKATAEELCSEQRHV